MNSVKFVRTTCFTIYQRVKYRTDRWIKDLTGKSPLAIANAPNSYPNIYTLSCVGLSGGKARAQSHGQQTIPRWHLPAHGMSYANTQGYECFLTEFRNLATLQMAWLPHDNPAKLQNASTMGLYKCPRGGRQATSHHDRGTSDNHEYAWNMQYGFGAPMKPQQLG